MLVIDWRERAGSPAPHGTVAGSFLRAGGHVRRHVLGRAAPDAGASVRVAPRRLLLFF